VYVKHGDVMNDIGEVPDAPLQLRNRLSVNREGVTLKMPEFVKDCRKCGGAMDSEPNR